MSDVNRNLIENINRAAKSALYKKLWKNVDTSHFKGIDDLAKLPFLERGVLFQTILNKRSKIPVAPVSQWFLSYERPGNYEWYPYSASDFLQLSNSLRRMASVIGLQGHVVVLAVVDVSPKITSFIPYLWLTSSRTVDLQLEFIVGSLDWYETMGMTWIDFVQKRKPSVLFSSAQNARLLAGKIESKFGRSIRDVLPDLRAGIFYGDVSEAQQTYNIESFQIYSPTENMMLCSECKGHNGMHIWLDRCVPEILLGQSHEALLFKDAKAGMVGELVITNFAECLPLIRYKTGKIVRLEHSYGCGCGCEDPRFTFLDKSVEAANPLIPP